eukprot:GILI01026316.1.p1 GENE.GILI01026316.1~~GILI01026316.1.p1  ORF type:complete len:438 (+),score=80.13 GILI01026316.1:50-1315(+)
MDVDSREGNQVGLLSAGELGEVRESFKSDEVLVAVRRRFAIAVKMAERAVHQPEAERFLIRLVTFGWPFQLPSPEVVKTLPPHLLQRLPTQARSALWAVDPSSLESFVQSTLTRLLSPSGLGTVWMLTQLLPFLDFIGHDLSVPGRLFSLCSRVLLDHGVSRCMDFLSVSTLWIGHKSSVDFLCPPLHCFFPSVLSSLVKPLSLAPLPSRIAEVEAIRKSLLQSDPSLKRPLWLLFTRFNWWLQGALAFALLLNPSQPSQVPMDCLTLATFCLAPFHTASEEVVASALFELVRQYRQLLAEFLGGQEIGSTVENVSEALKTQEASAVRLRPAIFATLARLHLFLPLISLESSSSSSSAPQPSLPVTADAQPASSLDASSEASPSAQADKEAENGEGGEDEEDASPDQKSSSKKKKKKNKRR